MVLCFCIGVAHSSCPKEIVWRGCTEQCLHVLRNEDMCTLALSWQRIALGKKLAAWVFKAEKKHRFGRPLATPLVYGAREYYLTQLGIIYALPSAH